MAPTDLDYYTLSHKDLAKNGFYAGTFYHSGIKGWVVLIFRLNKVDIHSDASCDYINLHKKSLERGAVCLTDSSCKFRTATREEMKQLLNSIEAGHFVEYTPEPQIINSYDIF
jgi:hypothetical protein